MFKPMRLSYSVGLRDEKEAWWLKRGERRMCRG
jgi:hypothetical protein